MELGSIEFHVIQNCFIRFDGGAMFGHVPKVVWQKLIEADEFNRVECACNTVLAKVDGKWILTDPGMGNKWTDKEFALYGLRVKSYDELLAPFGIAPSDIDILILSHLHIDHAGGCTKVDEAGQLALVFPNARVYIQSGEWECAMHPDPRSQPSYREADFVPMLEADRIEMIDGAAEIIPGVSVRISGGHTLHHQIVVFESEGEKLYYLADIFPSSAHLKPHWVLGYDLYPMGVMQARKELLPELTCENVRVVFGHDPRTPFGRMRSMEGKTVFEPMAMD